MTRWLAQPLSSGPRGHVHPCILKCRQGSLCAQDGVLVDTRGRRGGLVTPVGCRGTMQPAADREWSGVVPSRGKCALSPQWPPAPFSEGFSFEPQWNVCCIFESRVKELPLLRTFNSSAQTPYRLQRPQPRFRPRRPPPALRDHRPPRPSAQQLAQPILRNCGLRPRPPPPPRARPRPRPRPPRTRGRAQCLRGCCSPRRPRRACPVSGLASPVGSATSFPKKSRSDQCCGNLLHACLPDPTPMPPWTLSFPALNLLT